MAYPKAPTNASPAPVVSTGLHLWSGDHPHVTRCAHEGRPALAERHEETGAQRARELPQRDVIRRIVGGAGGPRDDGELVLVGDDPVADRGEVGRDGRTRRGVEDGDGAPFAGGPERRCRDRLVDLELADHRVHHVLLLDGPSSILGTEPSLAPAR